DSICASSSAFASTASASLSIRSLRSRGVVSDHPPSKALRAAATARLTSSSVPLGTWAITFPVAGLTISWVSLPVPGVHSPPMNISWRRKVVLIAPSLGSAAGGDFSERRTEYVQALLQLLVWDRQRHQCADDVVVYAAAQDDQPFVTRRGQDLRGLLVRRLLVCRLRTSSMPAIAPTMRTSPTRSC